MYWVVNHYMCGKYEQIACCNPGFRLCHWELGMVCRNWQVALLVQALDDVKVWPE